jgi:hypothetical protein
MDVTTESRKDLRCYVSWMGVDGIARTVVKDNAEVQLEDAVENSVCINALPGPDRFVLLIDSRPIKSITKEARDHFSMRGRESRVIGFAILIHSPLSTIIGNFFMGLNKPRVPMRLFTDEEKALEWCKALTNKQPWT